MCGICGIVDFTDRPLDEAALTRMRDTMRSRGPDDAGAAVLPHAALGHRRLSIIDLSPRGRQPMTNEDQTVWLVFNGEIYDYEPLRRELASRHRFVSDSDSEVLVHGYEQWGIDGLVSRINGMFAFAIWDAPRRALHLVRDRLGKKPLYYGWWQNRFVFASELKALWALAPGDWAPNEESIARFLYWGYVPGRETCYAGVFQLLPARVLTIAPDRQAERRYWRLSFADKVRAPVGDVVEQTDAVLTAAVRRRLRSDVPLGAFLSGGVDSSYIVSRMVGHTDSPVRTIAMGTSDDAHDERPHARLVAAHCSTEHVDFEITADAWHLLPRLVAEFGQPFADAACISTYYVAEHARRYVTVVLTGDGGDESFGGYSHHQGQLFAALLRRAVPGAVTESLLRRTTQQLDDGGRTMRASAARFLRYLHPDPFVRWASVDHWGLHHLQRLWTPRYRDLASPTSILGYALEADGEFDGASPLDRALHHDLNVLLPFCFNVKLDVASMMSSLEARCPLQDRDVVEWAARVEPGIKMRHGARKWLLKRVAAKWIPREAVYRQKRGFTLPVDSWFRGPWADAARAIVFSDQARDRGFFDYEYIDRLWTAHAGGVAGHGMRLWAILWLEMWFRMFIDSPHEPAHDAADAPGAEIAATGRGA